MPKSFRPFLLSLALLVGVAFDAHAASLCTGSAYALPPSPPSSFNWTDTTVWVPNGSYPGAAACDSAVMASTTPTTVSVLTPIPNSLSSLLVSCSSCVVDIEPGGSLSLGGASSIGANASIYVNGGTLNVDGPLTIQGGGQLRIGSGGAITGSGSIDIIANGQLLFDGGSGSISGPSVTNAGTISLAPAASGATFSLGGTTTISSSGTIYIDGNLSNFSGGAANVVTSTGALQHGGSGTTTMFAPLAANGGTIDILSGTLSVAANGSSNAPITLSADGAFDVTTGSTFTLTPNGSVSGAGALSVSGGTLTIGGVTSPSNFLFSGGTLNGSGFLSIGSMFYWSGGTFSGSGGTELAGAATALVDGAYGALTIDGRTFNVYGTMFDSSLSNAITLTNGGVLAIYGTFDFQDDASIYGASGAVLLSPNGTLSKTGGTGVSEIRPPLTNNSSMYAQSGRIVISGDGTHGGAFIPAPGAAIEFNASATTLTANSAAFGGGEITFSGSGTTSINGYYSVGTTTLFGRPRVDFFTSGDTDDLEMSGGSLDIGGDFFVLLKGTWSGGTISGGGYFEIADTASFTIDASFDSPTLDGILFDNEGTTKYVGVPFVGNEARTGPARPNRVVLIGGGLTLMNAAELDNYGLFDIQTDLPILAGGLVPTLRTGPAQPNAFGSNTIYNFGVWQKSADTGATDIVPDFTNEGSVLALAGTMNFVGSYVQDQAPSNTTLGPGAISVPNSAASFTAGVLDGAGTLTGDATNAATVAPGSASTAGIIGITGNYTQTAAGALHIDLFSEQAYDRLVVNGAALLDGTLVVSLANGFVPVNGDTFTIVTVGSRSGDFVQPYTLPTFGTGGSFTASWVGNSLVLTAVITAPTTDLALNMTGTSTATAGGALSYQVTVSSVSGATTSGTITVADTLPAGATGASASGSGWSCGAPSGGVITCTTTTALAAGQSLPPITVTATAGTSAGNVTNSATVNGPYGDPNGTNNNASVTTNVAAAPSADLSIVKSGPATVAPGQNISYTITFSNAGTSAAPNSVISDPTPVGLAFLSNSGACTTPFPCSLGTLNAGQGGTITSTYTVPSSYGGATITNTATINSSLADPNSGDNTSSVTTNVTQQTDLSISKSGPPTATPGTNIVYTVTVSNLGPSPAAAVTVQDPPPSGLTFVSNAGACVTPYPCNVGTLNPGQVATITSTYAVPAGYSGTTITNTASVSSAASDTNAANNSATLVTPILVAAGQTDLRIQKSGPPSATAGQNIVYTLTISNLGNTNAPNVTVSDPTPPGLTFVSNAGACTGPFPCNAGTVNAGQTVTITSTYNIPPSYAGTSITNVAAVHSTIGDPNPANNTASVTTPATAQADLAIVKNGPPSATQGQNVVYAITVTNNGPLVATNVIVSDPTPAGLTFAGNSGACASAFPCNIGTLAPGQSATINAAYAVPANQTAPITNTASVSSTSAPDFNSANNSSTVVTPVAAPPRADLSIVKSGTTQLDMSRNAKFTLVITNAGPAAATNVVVDDPTPRGMTFSATSGACTTPFPCSLGTLGPGQSATINATYAVPSTTGGLVTNYATVSSDVPDPNPNNNFSSVTVSTSTCPSTAPALVQPAANAVVSSPVTFSWTPFFGATGYVVAITSSDGTASTLTVSGPSASAPLGNGKYTWSVVPTGTTCPAIASSVGSFTVCTPAGTPVISVVGESTSGQPYAVQWSPISGATAYELQEADDPSFANPRSSTVTSSAKVFVKTIAAGAGARFYYRVRAVSLCEVNGAFSPAVDVAVVPLPRPTDNPISINVADGTAAPLTFQLFVAGPPSGGTSTFVAAADKPWMSVIPSAGIVGPDGILLTVAIDPTGLANGTWTGTIVVAYGSTSIGKLGTNATTTTTSATPVSVNVATPVSPTSLSTPASSALIIPTVGHLPGLSSTWRSDIRVANVGTQSLKYQLTLTPGDPTQTIKTTTITIDPGVTTALDDVVRKWFGQGSLGESSNAMLAIQPLDAAGKPVDATSAKASIISSRTYSASASSSTGAGTVGQFIPAVPFASFISNSPGAKSLLTLQQIAQSDNYRTNLGLVEGSGKAAQVQVSVFDGSGAKVLELPVTLRGGEQRQLNAFLAERGIKLDNGHIEVQSAGGEGKVTAYASVVDNRTGDPLFVTGTPFGANANKFVVPGIADLVTGAATWHSDLRIFNGGAAAQSATLTFFPIGNAAQLSSKTVAIAPGETKAIDDVLQSFFGAPNSGGTLHVTTAQSAPLVVTARTYDQENAGTVGQFIPAVTLADTVGTGERTLHIVQLEESPRYRTNLGLAEVSGKPVTLDVSVVLPDSKVIPHIIVPLGAYETQQLPLLSKLGIGNAYNARITVKVTDGDGRVTAYGSVIDRATQDPTYVPAQ